MFSNFFEKEDQKTGETSEASIAYLAEEEKEHQELMEYNRLENERMAKIRSQKYEFRLKITVIV